MGATATTWVKMVTLWIISIHFIKEKTYKNALEWTKWMSDKYEYEQILQNIKYDQGCQIIENDCGTLP